MIEYDRMHFVIIYFTLSSFYQYKQKIVINNKIGWNAFCHNLFHSIIFLSIQTIEIWVFKKGKRVKVTWWKRPWGKLVWNWGWRLSGSYLHRCYYQLNSLHPKNGCCVFRRNGIAEIQGGSWSWSWRIPFLPSKRRQQNQRSVRSNPRYADSKTSRISNFFLFTHKYQSCILTLWCLFIIISSILHMKKIQSGKVLWKSHHE